MVIAFSSIGLTFHPSNLTASGSQSFAGTRGDSKGRSPWRAFGDFPRDGKVTRGGGAERPLMGRSTEDGAPALLARKLSSKKKLFFKKFFQKLHVCVQLLGQNGV